MADSLRQRGCGLRGQHDHADDDDRRNHDVSSDRRAGHDDHHRHRDGGEGGDGLDHADHEVLTRALAVTAPLMRRPRGPVAEYGRVWARAIVADEMAKGSKKDAAIRFAAEALGVEDRTIWNALAPPPVAPPLTVERLRKIVANNLEITKRSGNTRAAEMLRRLLATF